MQKPAGNGLHSIKRFTTKGMIAFLLKNGADPTLKDSDGKTAIHLAKVIGNNAAVVLLKSFKR